MGCQSATERRVSFGFAVPVFHQFATFLRPAGFAAIARPAGDAHGPADTIANGNTIARQISRRVGTHRDDASDRFVS